MAIHPQLQVQRNTHFPILLFLVYFSVSQWIYIKGKIPSPFHIHDMRPILHQLSKMSCVTKGEGQLKLVLAKSHLRYKQPPPPLVAQYIIVFFDQCIHFETCLFKLIFSRTPSLTFIKYLHRRTCTLVISLIGIRKTILTSIGRPYKNLILRVTLNRTVKFVDIAK